MNVLLRRMIENDLEQVIAIDKQSFSLPWPERSFRFELMENPASRCWVAEVDAKIAAMLVLWLIVDEAHLATIAVSPLFRRQGLGEKLLLHALRHVKAEGAVKCFLEVRSGNFAARAMYEKLGFVKDGLRKNYYKDNGEDAVLMTLQRLP